MFVDLSNRQGKNSNIITFSERSFIAAQYEKWCDEQPIKVQKNALSMISFLTINDLLDTEVIKLWIENRERES